MGYHDDVIKSKHFLCYWPFVRGLHWSLEDSPHKGQWHRALMFSLICAWTNGWVNNRNAGDLRRHCTHCDITVMTSPIPSPLNFRACSVDWHQKWIWSRDYNVLLITLYISRVDSRFAPSQWETALLCNDVSHWLGANLKSALKELTVFL